MRDKSAYSLHERRSRTVGGFTDWYKWIIPKRGNGYIQKNSDKKGERRCDTNVYKWEDVIKEVEDTRREAKMEENREGRNAARGEILRESTRLCGAVRRDGGKTGTQIGINLYCIISSVCCWSEHLHFVFWGFI